jgi:hypothetical protein
VLGACDVVLCENGNSLSKSTLLFDGEPSGIGERGDSVLYLLNDVFDESDLADTFDCTDWVDPSRSIAALVALLFLE